MVRFSLFYLLLQHSKFGCIKKIDQCDSEAIAKHFDGHDSGILTFPIKDVLNRGRCHRRFHRKLVNRHFVLTEQLQQPVSGRDIGIHAITPLSRYVHYKKYFLTRQAIYSTIRL